MTVCRFFLQGTCRYGDKCWNEHPRGGGGGGGGRGGGGGGAGSGDYSRGTPPSNRGGFGNRVWVNPQRAGGGDFVKPSSFGGRDAPRNSSFGVSTQNRFGALNTPSNFAGGGPKDENEKHLETIQKDMEIWEASGQWLFSCYSVLKDTISGFVELSQEELRLEYYTGRASGDLQTYGNSVQQLAAQWRNRLQELKAMNGNTRSAMIAELNNPGQHSSFGSSEPSGFDSSSSFSGFGSTAPSGFGAAAAPASGFGSSTASSSGFGSGGFGAPAQPSAASFSFSSSQSAAPAPSGFGSAQQSSFGSTAPPAAQSASSFSFASPAAAVSAPATTQASSTVFGSASGFSFASTAAPAPPSSSAGGFGFGATAGFGKPTNSGLFSSAGAAPAATTDVASAGSLFTPQSELTPDELKEFMAKRFTLGQIPLKPPPADLLVI